MSASPLIHLHIPKNGGTTLGRMIKVRLLMRPSRCWRDPVAAVGFPNVRQAERRMAFVHDLPPSRRRRVAFFEAHRGYGIHECLDAPPRYVTMLRDPVQRALSIYQVLRDELPGGMAPADFVAWDGGPDPRGGKYVWWVDNAHVRYLAAENGSIIDVPPGEVTRDMLDLAKSRVDTMDFVLLLERFDESVLRLSAGLGWSPMYYRRSNVAAVRLTPDAVREQDLAAIREHNRLDLELYDHARRRLERDLAGLDRLDARLERYRRGNARHAKLAAPLYATMPKVRSLLVTLREGRRSANAAPKVPPNES